MILITNKIIVNTNEILLFSILKTLSKIECVSSYVCIVFIFALRILTQISMLRYTEITARLRTQNKK